MAISVVQTTHNQEAYSTRQGMALKFPALVGSGNTIVTFVFGRKNPDPYQAGRTTTLDGSMDANTPGPTVKTAAGVAFTGRSAFQSIDAQVSAPSYPSTLESLPDMNGDYPSIYVYTRGGAVAGDTVVVNSAYAGPTTPGVADANAAAGISMFNAGVNAVAVELTGLASGFVAEQHQLTSANPALSASGTMGAAADNILAAGYQKNGNVFAASAGWTVLYSDKCVSSQDHFVVAYKILAGADHASFSNPLGYKMAIAAVDIR
jgi:hypothetical protein